jgi:hypothetical protein
MTYFYTCDKCGASIKIETDDLKYAETKIKAWEKKHERCKDVKHEKPLYPNITDGECA